MADWSYASEELREIKRHLALREFNIASQLIKEIYTSNDFYQLAIPHFKNKDLLCRNFINWCRYIEFNFVPANHKENWDEDNLTRGNLYTLPGDFFTAFVSNNDDIFAMMLHEYLHHVIGRVLWEQITSIKEYFTINEKNFIEDMYVNGWIRTISKPIADKWQLFLVNHDLFHGLYFNQEERKYNSLLTENVSECNIALNQLYDNLREDNIDLLEVRHFAYFISVWHTVLQEDPEVKSVISNLQINKISDDYKSCDYTPEG